MKPAENLQIYTTPLKLIVIMKDAARSFFFFCFVLLINRLNEAESAIYISFVLYQQIIYSNIGILLYLDVDRYAIYFDIGRKLQNNFIADLQT